VGVGEAELHQAGPLVNAEAAIEAGDEKSPISATIFLSLTNFSAMTTDCFGSAWVSSNWYSILRPLMPPLALTSSTAMSNAFFQICPYSAFGPVSGPLTPKTMFPLPPPTCEQPVTTARSNATTIGSPDQRLIRLSPSFGRASVEMAAPSSQVRETVPGGPTRHTSVG